MKKINTFLTTAVTILLMCFLIASRASAQSKVVVTGNFQSETGCVNDWDSGCTATALNYNAATGLWAGTFKIPTGCWEYRIASFGTVNNTYGEKGTEKGVNISLYIDSGRMVTFSYDPSTHLVSTSPVASGFSVDCLPKVVLNIYGSTNHELELTYNDSVGLFEGEMSMYTGTSNYIVWLNDHWNQPIGVDGSIDGDAYLLSVPGAFFVLYPVHFSYDPINHIVSSPYNSDQELPTRVAIGGQLGGDFTPPYLNPANELYYNPYKKVFERDRWIKGCFDYTIETFGSIMYRIPGRVSVPGDGAYVHFSYNPATVTTSCSYESAVCQPEAVVIAGSFQTELGCANDWVSDCDKTGLAYVPSTQTWTDTFSIPEGNWLFKVALNHSFDETYGINGIRDGEAIELSLCYPAKVAFTYDHRSHQVTTKNITNGICLSKVYDTNINNYPDEGELPMSDVSFTLTGNGIKQVQTTGSNGRTSFTNLPNGQYWIKETVPSGYISVQDSQMVNVYNGLSTVYFGNVCIGAGPGGTKEKGFWTSKNGEVALNDAGKMEYALMELRNLNLHNANGSDFDPYTYDQLRAWLKWANARNMVYMVSAQLATLDLNQTMGYINTYNSTVYTGKCDGLFYSKFMNTKSLIWYSNCYLGFIHRSTANDPSRSFFVCLKNVLESTNNNLNFVQPKPCGVSTIAINHVVKENAAGVFSKARIWPNPSSRFFTLRPATSISNEPVTVNVFDVHGKKLYRATGSAYQDYRIGDAFVPGIYFVELMQGKRRSTFKLFKQ